MNRFLLVAALISALVFSLGIAMRVVDDTIAPFTYAAAAGWLNVDDGREFALKGTHTVNKFGFNADVDASEESIWDADDLPTEGDGPARCFTNMGTTAAALYISSDDENDASDNNAVTVTVEGLDANWNVVTESDVALGVASAGGTVFAQVGTATWLRVNRAYVTSTSAAVGNVYIGLDDVDGGTDGIPDTIATDSIAVITAGENQTLQACYTVPADFTALVSQFCIGNLSQAAAAQDVTFRLRRSVEGAASRTTELMTLADSVQTCVEHDPPAIFGEKTDIELTAIAGGASQGASGTFDVVLVPE